LVLKEKYDLINYRMTKQQLVRKILYSGNKLKVQKKKREEKVKRNKSVALMGNPQLSGVCLKTFVMNPKKPNSANRKGAKVRLSKGGERRVYVPGDKMAPFIQEHQKLLIRGIRRLDCPGINLGLAPGLDFKVPDGHRANKRSKYGVKKKRV
jgi:small subunit ribosomal protein S12